MAKDLVTYEGAAAYSRDAKSDLFLLGSTSYFGEDTFYEKANERNDRFIGLVHRVAREDPAWLLSFLPWLRRDANIRTAAVVGAVEAARVLALAGQQGNAMGPARRVLAETLLRADEPAEALAYWLKTYGRKIPNPVRRGIADAAKRLYTERNYIKWDSDRASVRMADVVELTHPEPSVGKFDSNALHQSALFKFMLDSRRRATFVPNELLMLKSREMLLAMSPEKKLAMLNSDDPERMSNTLRSAGMTWEQVSSWGKFTPAAWEALIPTMGYMALLRNLRNFQEAPVSDGTLTDVAQRIGNQVNVMASRQMPYRFLSAYIEATHPVWSLALETALQYSIANIPALAGRTLVLVDTSASMAGTGYGLKSKITPVMAGALFGVALALKGEQVDLYGFADGQFRHPVKKGAGVLRETERFAGRVGEVGHGTQIAHAVRATYSGHDRVVIVTDCQTFGHNNPYGVGDVSSQAPAGIPMYAFNMVGYAPAMMETSATRHELGGLTDRTFSMIPLVEAGQQAKWPWQEAS